MSDDQLSNYTYIVKECAWRYKTHIIPYISLIILVLNVLLKSGFSHLGALTLLKLFNLSEPHLPHWENKDHN